LEQLEVRELLAPLTWFEGPSLPVGRADAEAIRASDSSILLFGGQAAGPDVSVPRLVPGMYSYSGTWGAAHWQFGGGRASLGAGSLGGGGVLLFGGGAQAVDEAIRYDSWFGDHQDVANMLSPRTDLGSATDASNRPYAIGGLDDAGNVLASVERYDQVTEDWSLVAPLPAARFALAAVADSAGHIFAFGGGDTNDPASVTNTAFRYSIDSDTWDAVASMPVATRDSAAVLGSNGRIYVLGGSSGSGPIATVQSYDPATDTWSVEADLPAAVRDPAAASDSSGRVTVIGGYDAADTPATNVFVSQSLHVADFAPTIISTPVTGASLDKFYTYQARATGSPQASFSIVAGPAGMTIDSLRGLVSWQPAADQLGDQPVTIRAVNFAGQADQSFTIHVVADTTPPSVPTNLQVTGTTNDSVSLAWDAATDNVAVTGYRVFKVTRCGFHGIHTCYTPLAADFSGTTAVVGGLTPGLGYRFSVAALDDAGNQSGKAASVYAQTTSLPTISYLFGTINGPVSVVANHALSFQVYASGVPAPTVSLVSGPAGLTFDATTSRVNWTPVASDVGTATATLRATNSVGSTDLNVSITVNPDAPVLGYTFNGVPRATPFAVAEQPFALQLTDASLTHPTAYTLVSGPAGMSVDEGTGLVSWTPTADQAGAAAVTYRATNSAGSTDLSLNFTVFPPNTDKTPPSAATGVAVHNVTERSAELSWTAATDDKGVAKYNITAWYQFRSRGLRRVYFRFEATGDATSFVMTGLPAGKNMRVTMTATDAAGNTGPASNLATFFTVNPAGSPVLYVAPGTTIQSIAGESFSVQLIDGQNTLPTYELVSGPAGMAVDPATGLVTWNPTLGDVGRPTATFRATNAIGFDELTLTIPVYFTGAPSAPAVQTTRGVRSATASWTPPAQNQSEILGYHVYLTWSVGGRQRGSATYDTTSTSFTFPFLVGGPVLFKVRVAAYDSAGNVGLSSPLTSFILPK
jgi:hypothetical protein